jgi:hypothetical protein
MYINLNISIPLELHQTVHEYLEEFMLKSLSSKSKIPATIAGKGTKPGQLSFTSKAAFGRRFSVKGTIKRTRSIYRGIYLYVSVSE